MLTSNDAAEYNVAADALFWQSTMKTIGKFCTQYNMTSLLLIPQGVDLSKPEKKLQKLKSSRMPLTTGRFLTTKSIINGKNSSFALGHLRKLQVTIGLMTFYICQWRQLYVRKLNQTSSAFPYSNVVQLQHYAALSSVWSSKTKKPKMPLKTKLEGSISRSFLARTYLLPAFTLKLWWELLGMMTSRLLLSARS